MEQWEYLCLNVGLSIPKVGQEERERYSTFGIGRGGNTSRTDHMDTNNGSFRDI